ncbi:ABC transporter ATP-binding protein [Solimonas variicoloris]|uniref:ABC transporter ATP-binding protein n=1 Tax=Solimonas variicoloris TaxID=254408 RepID=UPI0003A8CD3C|nr:ATP-binding cassette domain-containing protein [Solimonas variicoloris]
MSAALRLSIETKRYGGRDALAPLRLDVADGEFVALLGPSGAGKTTLLQLIAGLDRDYRGCIVRGGGRIGMVFQEPRLLPWLSVRDNLALVGADEAGIDALLAAVGLREHAGVYAHRLSGGMQRRVALARAFAIRPRLLLLDEAFVSVDVPTRAQLYALLLALWARERPTVLCVTHELREALLLADRLLFFSAAPGRVIAERRVPLPRPRRDDDVALEALARQWRPLLDGIGDTVQADVP